MNCTEIDIIYEDGMRGVHTDMGFWTLVLLGGTISSSLLVFGEKLARPFAGLLAFAGGTSFVYVVTQSSGLPCIPRVVLALVGGLSMASLAWCLLKGGLFVLGGAAFGSVAHFVYEAIRPSDDQTPFEIVGRSAYYLITVGVAGLSGAIVAVVMRKHVLRVTSSLLGGAGLTAVVHAVSSRIANDEEVSSGSGPVWGSGETEGFSAQTLPPVVLLVVLLGSTAFGIVSQHWMAQKRKKLKEEKV